MGLQMPKAVVSNHQFLRPISQEDRNYRLIQLSNGIVTFLISDPTTSLASCSLSVATGHHADPDDCAGLAHFCEHMICVSSSEYPETDLYKKTVLQAGGSLNAVTVGEKTSFYFELPSFSDANTTEEPIFSTVLKIFSSYFKSPLFDNKYTNREINAIDSEHTNNRAALNKLTFHGLRLLANKEHPFNRFSTGNFHTLHDILQEKGLNIRDELVKFYQNEYISSRMSLVIRGPASLNKLQKLAVESFSTIPSQNASTSKSKIFKMKSTKNIEPIESKTPLAQSNIIRDYWLPKYKSDAFGEHQKGKIILIDRNTTHPLLRLIFPLNEHHINGNQNRKNTEMYMNLFCSILGDESETSVNTILYKLNYIIEVMTLTPEISCENNMLELQLTLSSLGTKNIDKILTILFDYVQKTFQQNDKNTRRVAKLISQFNSIELYNFLYEDVNQEAANECRGLSSLLLNDLEGTLRWLIKGSPCWDHSDDGYKGGYGESDAAKSWWTRKAAEISSLMSQTVTPANMIISYISPESNFKFIQCLDCLPVEFQEDQHFGFRYKICDIKFKPTPYEGEIRLPRPNPFCPQTAEDQTNLLKILEDASQDSIASSLLCPKNNSNNATNPILISSEDGYQLWVKRETSLASKDKAFLSLELTNTRMKPSATNSLCMEILLDLVIQNLREILYPSLELRYSYDLFPSLKGDVGVIIHISGPINKLYSILLLIITEIKNISSTFDELVKSERFRKARVRLKLKCEALNNIPSYEVASLGLMVVLEEYTWSLEDRLQYLEELDFQTVAHFSKHAFDSCYVSSLLQGDVNDSDYSLNIVPVLQKLVGTFEAEHYHYPSTVLLPKSANLKILGASPDETNALVYYVQTGIRDNVYQSTMTSFLAFILSTSFSFKIRTQYQLGYIALVGVRALRETTGIHITIMSGDHPPEDLDNKIDALIMEWFTEFTHNLTNETFEKQYIDKFISFCSNSNHKSGSMTSLTMGAVGSGLGSNRLMNQHQAYWDQIMNRSYKFSQNLSGEDSIDMSVIENLRLEEVLGFIKKSFLPTSIERSKVSIMLRTKSSKDEVNKMMRPIRLYMFLTSAGLPIRKESLNEILEKAGNSQAILAKELLKYYQSSGGSVRLATAFLAKSFKDLLSSRSTASLISDKNTYAVSEVVEIDINNIAEWQQEVGFYRNPQSLVTRLDSLRLE